MSIINERREYDLRKIDSTWSWINDLRSVHNSHDNELDWNEHGYESKVALWYRAFDLEGPASLRLALIFLKGENMEKSVKTTYTIEDEKQGTGYVYVKSYNDDVCFIIFL